MSSAQWEPYRALLPGIDVVSVDLPGHGSRAGEEFTRAAAMETIGGAVARAHARACAEGMAGSGEATEAGGGGALSRAGSDQAGCRPVLAGHSLGGYLSLMWAAEHEADLGALVLMGATADPRGPLTGVYRGFARVLPWVGQDRMARAANFVMRALGARGEHAEALPDGRAYAALPAAWDLVMTEGRPALLGAVECPVVLVNGQYDQMRIHVRRFAAAARDPHVVTVPRASHLMPSTHPDAVAATLRQAMSLAR